MSSSCTLTCLPESAPTHAANARLPGDSDAVECTADSAAEDDHLARRSTQDDLRPWRMARPVPTAAFALTDRALVLDRYRPLRPLGRGGSGSVWLARDERTGLEVALKIVPQEGKRAARAAREMEAASRLRHERCVRAYDFGTDDGHVYIAYEYVRGRTLRELIRLGELDDGAVVELSAQILEGLAHAHRRGIVHRDVKPSNVLVEEGAELSARVLDFGLAQFDDADTLTAVGDVPGTLAYISPERLDGRDATAQSDVWAVGVILWEALAGSHPFWGVPLPDVAATIVSGAPPLSARRGDLPRRLLATVDSALSVDPERRPPASRLATDLREALVAAPPDRAERRSPARRPRPTKQARPIAPPVPLAERLVPAGLAAVAAVVGASVLPFWPVSLVVLLALSAGLLTLRAPRAGLALVLFAPVFPLGNVAEAAALVYGALALVWLAVTWRDARAGLAFFAGPLLAPLGLIALLPLAVQPARGAWRRALHAAVGVYAAAAVAGLSGRGLPLGGDAVPDLGVAQSERPGDVVAALADVLRSHPELSTTALAFALVASLLPRARTRGRVGIALLGAAQLALVLLWAPGVPWPPLVAGTALFCGLLLAEPYAREFVGNRDRWWTRP
jgi:eukaryotic-like serine/threonine-protein kinase